jgi:hypothetical protein
MMGVEIEVKVPASRIWRIAILKKVGEAVLYPYVYYPTGGASALN